MGGERVSQRGMAAGAPVFSLTSVNTLPLTGPGTSVCVWGGVCICVCLCVLLGEGAAIVERETTGSSILLPQQEMDSIHSSSP